MARIRHTNRMHRGEDDSDYTAEHLDFDPAPSGLTATNVQDAIDEVVVGGSVITEITDLPTAETDTSQRLAPDGAGGVEWGAGGSPTEILDIPTAETDDTLVLAPDGAGGVEFRAETGGGGGGGTDFEAYLATLSGLVHQWEFEEASGNFADSVGSLALVPSGTHTYQNAGLLGAGPYSAGFSSGGYARSSGLGSIPVGANPRTIITIYRTDGVQTGKAALNSYGATGSTRQWWMAGINETFGWTTELDLWGDDLVGGQKGSGDGNWHMHAAGADGNRMSFVYIDGDIEFRNVGGALGTASGGDFTVAQSSDIGGFSLPLTGYIDEVLVFDRMLLKAELDQLHLRLGGTL